MKKIIFGIFSLIVLVSAWFYSDLWLAYQEAIDAQTELSKTIDELEVDAQVINQTLRQEQSANELKSRRIDALEKDLAEALKPVSMSLNYQEIDASERFIYQTTDLLFLPEKDQANLAIVEEGNLVRVIEEAHNQKTQATYLYIEIRGPKPLRGYVLKDHTTYFTPDLETQVTNPLTISAGKDVFKGPDKEAIVLDKEVRGRLVSENDQGQVSLRTYDDELIMTDKTNLVYPKSAIR